MRYPREGALGKAVTTLSSEGVHCVTDAVTEMLFSKNPQSVPSSDVENIVAHDEKPELRIDPFSDHEIISTVRSFARGTAGGGSGLTINHLREMLDMPTSESASGLASGLSKVATRFESGDMPDCIISWVASARLTPLVKRDGGVRPVAIGETLRRIISSTLNVRVKKWAIAYLMPLQVGVGIPSGCEAVVHAARCIENHIHDDSRYGLLKVDLPNAFNLISRSAFL